MIEIAQQLAKLGNKNFQNYLFTADEVIAFQSSYYYANAEEQLGYYTIAQNEENYKKKISELLEELLLLEEEKKKVTILELGGGTGNFARYLTTYLQKQSIQYDYTIVDISTNQYDKIKKDIPNLTIIQKSFTEFVSENKKNYDVLVMNEALDMWAGKQVLLERWHDNKLPYEVFWVVVNIEDQKLLKKKEVAKIKTETITNYLWVKVFVNIEKREIKTRYEGEYREKIEQPEALKQLIEKINLLTIIQDYWSFEDQENKLRMGLYEESVEKTLHKIPALLQKDKEELLRTWTQELEKTSERKAWIESNKIPFGLVDVTYSPNQGEIFTLSLDLNLELVNYYAENVNTFDDRIYSVGEQENEIFMLFTPYASELRFKKELNL